MSQIYENPGDLTQTVTEKPAESESWFAASFFSQFTMKDGTVVTLRADPPRRRTADGKLPSNAPCSQQPAAAHLGTCPDNSPRLGRYR
jgi:hypothetical protein